MISEVKIIIYFFKRKIFIFLIFSREPHKWLLLYEDLRILLWLRIHHGFNLEGIFCMFGMLLYFDFNLFLIYLLDAIQLVNIFWIAEVIFL